MPRVLGILLAFLLMASPALAGLAEDLREANQAFDRGHYTRAVELFSKLLNNPQINRRFKGQLYYNRGNALRFSGKIDRALADYSQAIKLLPGWPYAIYNRGLLHMEAGNLAQALADFGRVIRILPKQASPYVNHGRVLQKMGRHQQALADFDRALKLQPKMIPVYYDRGMSRAALGRRQEALADFARVSGPGVPMRLRAQARFVASLQLVELGRLSEAVAALDRVIKLAPKQAKAFFNRALLQQYLGRRQEALADYRAYLALVPADQKARRMMTKLARGLRPKVGARSSLPPDPLPGAVAAHLSGRPEASLAAYQRALAHPGRRPAERALIHLNQGVLLHHLGSLGQAIKEYQSALALSPDWSKAYFNLGVAYEELGRYDQALTAYRRALSRRPKLALALYNLGNLFYRRKDYLLAEAAYDQALQVDGRLAPAYFNRSLVRERKGRLQSALADMRRYLRLAPHQPAGMERLKRLAGRMLQKMQGKP